MDSVSALQVYTAKSHSSLPAYTFSSTSPVQNQNVFICKVYAFDEVAEGRGLSQKEAKKSAATNLINKLKINRPYLCRNDDVLSEEPHLNAVQRLCVYCEKKSLPTPIFEFVESEKPLGSNLIMHKCRCIVGNIEKFAKHARKSTAKNLAALDVFNLLNKSSQGNAKVRIDEVVVEKKLEDPQCLSDFTIYRELTKREKTPLTDLLTKPIKTLLLSEEPHLNAVQRLCAYCEKKSLPTPIFEFVENEKPLGSNLIMHQCRCIVGNIEKFAKHTRKSTAKNLAALDVFNLLNKSSQGNAKVRIDEVVVEKKLEDPQCLSDFTIYRELTKREKTSLTDLLTKPIKTANVKDPYERHNYFKNLLTPTERERIKLIARENFIGSYKEKVNRILGLLGFQYTLTTFPTRSGGSLQVFELKSELDVVILGTKENIFQNVLGYFVEMIQ